MLIRFNHLVLASAAIAALSLLDPAPVRASHGGFNVDFCNTTCEVIVLGTFILPPLMFVTVEAVYAAQWRWFPLGWAIPELIYGGLMTSLMVAVASNATDAGSIVPFVVGYGWLTTHALLSLIVDDRARDRTARDRPPPDDMQIERPQIGFAPLEGGGWVGIRGRL